MMLNTQPTGGDDNHVPKGFAAWLKSQGAKLLGSGVKNCEEAEKFLQEAATKDFPGHNIKVSLNDLGTADCTDAFEKNLQAVFSVAPYLIEAAILFGVAPPKDDAERSFLEGALRGLALMAIYTAGESDRVKIKRTNALAGAVAMIPGAKPYDLLKDLPERPWLVFSHNKTSPRRDEALKAYAKRVLRESGN